MNIVNFDRDVCALTDTGLVRPHNEDSNRLLNTSNGELFVVCDGMGGHVGGATASRIAVESISQYVSENSCVIPQQFLVKALEYANERIYAETRIDPSLKGMGTTACVALVREDKVWYAHVGDSRIYYYNKRFQTLYRLTKDHSVVQALVDQGLISEAEAEHHPDKNKIRKSLGIKPTVEAEPCQMPLVPSTGDILLICSDGLSGMVSEDDMLEVLATIPDINEAGKTLIDLAKAGGGSDNITVQLIRFSNAGTRDAVFDAKNQGVALSSEVTPKAQPKRLWPWIVIAASVLTIILSVLFMPSDKNASSSNNVTPITTDSISAEQNAFEKEIPADAKVLTYEDGGIEYQLYKRPGNPDGDLLVNMKNFTYETGEFVPCGPIYKGKEGRFKRFNKDGTPRE